MVKGFQMPYKIHSKFCRLANIKLHFTLINDDLVFFMGKILSSKTDKAIQILSLESMLCIFS